jgi:hypothetical protein
MTCIPILVFCLLHLYLSLLIKSRFKFEIETKKIKKKTGQVVVPVASAHLPTSAHRPSQ